jgi:hypothetical protein
MERRMNEMVAQRIVEILIAAQQLQEISASDGSDKQVLEALWYIRNLAYSGMMEMQRKDA